MEMREVYGRTLVELARQDERIVVIDADLNTSTRTDIFLSEIPGRFIQLGIAEQNAFGWAAGLSAMGFIPFPSTFACFASTRALDQVRVAIAYQYRNVKIPGSYPGISADKGGGTHESIEDLAIMRAIPNMRVLAPADATELRQVMHAIVEYNGPVYFRVTKYELPDLFDESYEFDWKPVLLRDGADVTLVGTGYMTHKCVEAAEILAREGVDASVVHVPCLKPLDGELLTDLARKTKAMVTAEDHNIHGGLGSSVAELLSGTCPTYVERVGIKDHFCKSGDEDELCEAYGLRAEDVATAAKKVMGKKPTY